MIIGFAVICMACMTGALYYKTREILLSFLFILVHRSFNYIVERQTYVCDTNLILTSRSYKFK